MAMLVYPPILSHHSSNPLEDRISCVGEFLDYSDDPICGYESPEKVDAVDTVHRSLESMRSDLRDNLKKILRSDDSPEACEAMCLVDTELSFAEFDEQEGDEMNLVDEDDEQDDDQAESEEALVDTVDQGSDHGDGCDEDDDPAIDIDGDGDEEVNDDQQPELDDEQSLMSDHESTIEDDEELLTDEEHTILLREPAEQAEIQEEMVDLEEAVPALSADYQLLDRLGTGTFSSVYKAIDRWHHSKWDNSLWHIGPPVRGDAFVAVKRIYVTSSPERILNEIDILAEVRGTRHVTQIITAFRALDQVVVILPYHRNDDFRVRIRADFLL